VQSRNIFELAENMAAPDFNRLRRTSACAVTLDTDGRVLLHRRTDNGRWALPGGVIEIGETAAQAVVREVGEETGYVVEVIRLIGIYSEPRHTTITYPDGNVCAYVAIAFECQVIGGSPALSDETSAVDWFDPAALPDAFHPAHLPRLQDALARQTAAFYR
jgi:8-oxo-dGTP pyrophosphatase MutT (NUDIX family)